MHLRTANGGDLGALSDVYRRSSLSNPSDRVNLLANPDALEFPGDAIDDDRTFVAVLDGRLVGFATLGPVADGVVELEDLFVDPERMRRGIGRALVTEAATRARTVGGVRIEVTANPDARAFYESVGFVDVGAAETRFGLAPRMSLEIREGPSDRP